MPRESNATFMMYTIQGQLAPLNEHDAANRSNRFAGAKLKEQMTELVAKQLLGKPKISRPCFIKFHWLFSSRHDFDNIRFSAKYILDGMVKAGILVNDNQTWVLGFDGDDFTKVAKGEEGVIVEVEEVYE